MLKVSTLIIIKLWREIVDPAGTTISQVKRCIATQNFPIKYTLI